MYLIGTGMSYSHTLRASEERREGSQGTSKEEEGKEEDQDLLVIRGRDKSSPLIEEGDSGAGLEMIVVLLTHCPCSNIPLGMRGRSAM
jgi:hypothetical protein